MKSKEEIIEGLRNCSENYTCRPCPYYKESGCIRKLAKDALVLIEGVQHQNSIPEAWKESVMQSFMKGE